MLLILRINRLNQIWTPMGTDPGAVKEIDPAGKPFGTELIEEQVASLKNKFYFAVIILLGLSVQAVYPDWIANAAVAVPETTNDVKAGRRVFGPPQRSLTLISLSPVIAGGKTIGTLALYDDPITQRSEDYLELYDSEGELVAVGWFDQFGIQRMAVDRALLEGKPGLHGVFVTVVDGESI